MRSIFGATLPLAGPSMYAALTPQWAGTLLGLLEVMLIPIPIVFYKFGDRIRARSPVIRQMREEQARNDRKRARQNAKMERQREMADGSDGGGGGGNGVVEELDRNLNVEVVVDEKIKGEQKEKGKEQATDVEKGA